MYGIVKMMKIKLKNGFYAFGLVFLLSNPGILLAANSVAGVVESDRIAVEQDSVEVSGQNDEISRYEDNNLEADRRLRLMTIENLIRSQRVAQSTSLPR